MSDLHAIPVKRKTGDESFRDGDRFFGFTVLDFWKWSGSDLLSNAARGVLAEFLVAQAIGVTDSLRVEWDAKGLIAPQRGWDASTNVMDGRNHPRIIVLENKLVN